MKRKKYRPLDERHFRAIEMIADIHRLNYEIIAKRLSVDRRTLYRWRKRKDFAEMLRKTIDRNIREKFGPPFGSACNAIDRGDITYIELFMNRLSRKSKE